MTPTIPNTRFILRVAALAVAVLATSPVLAVTSADLPVGRWVAVSSNTVSSVNPCSSGNGCSYSGNTGQKDVMGAWSGGAFATGLGASGSLLVFGGGHSGYLGNEVYAFDVAVGSWSRLTNPVSPPDCDYNTSTMAGNSPCSAHTYDYLEYSPITNEFVKLGSSSDGYTVEGTANVHALNLQTKTWRRAARMPTWEGTISDDGEGATSAWDGRRNVIWWHGSWRAAQTSNKTLRKFDPVANSWVEYPGQSVNIDAAAAFDDSRQIFLVVDGRNNHKVYAYDTSVETPVVYELTTTGDLTAQRTSAIGLDYDPVTDQFVAWVGGSAVYTLKAPANWKTGTWTWTRVAAASDSASPSPQDTGTYGRFRYVPALNAFIVANSTTTPVYMYKLSASAGSPGAGTPPTVSLSASPNSISAGSATTLSWSSSDATACTASGAWSGSKATSGSQSVGPLNATSTFTLSCTGSGGTMAQNATVQVVTSGPTITLSANPATVSANGSTVLSWSASNATTCTASGAWTGSKALSSSQTVGPLTATSTYTLSCTGSGGTNQRSAIVTVQSASQSNDFQSRCTGPGVVKCVGFDTSADYTAAFLKTDSEGVIRGVMDTNVKASGAGALRFEIPSNSGANSSGYWLGSLGKDFGPGDKLHMQFRQRFSQTMLSTYFEPGGGWKQFILHPFGQPSCTTLQFVMNNGYLRGFPTMYASCGAYGFDIEMPNGDIRIQQGDVDCRYRDKAGCMYYRPDEWMTFYYEITFGNFGSPTTHIKAWMGNEGQALKQIIDFPNFSLDYSSSPTERLNMIQLTNYHTGKDWTQAHPTAHTWYDELIVSTQPIPAPTGVVASPPAATPPAVTLTAQPASVSSGGTTQLSWSAANADSCTASGGWSGSRATSGSASVGPITQATSFTLQCFNSVGDADSRTLQVTVAQAAPAPVIDFYADPATVELGASSRVYWSVTNAYSCVGGNAWSGEKGSVGSEPIFLSGTRTYSLSCTGNGGSSSKSATIQVVSPGQPTLTLLAGSSSVQQGATGVLSWNTTNVNSCQASGAWTGARAGSGAETVGPLSATSSFGLVCTGPGGSVEAVTQIAVAVPPGSGGGGGTSTGGTTGGATGSGGTVDGGTSGGSTGGTSASGPFDLLLGLFALAAVRRRQLRSA